MVSNLQRDRIFYPAGDQLLALEVEGRSWNLVSTTPNGIKLHFHAMAVDQARGDIKIFSGGSQGLQYADDLLVFQVSSSAWAPPYP